jgi:hypothetical protein
VIDEMLRTFDYTVRFMDRSVDDLSDEEMVVQPPDVPNHGTWTLGHIIFACQGMATELGAEAWLPEDWESVFGYGSTPRPAGSDYPKKAELQALLSTSAERLLRAVRDADESLMERPLDDEDFPTMGHVLLQVVVAHTAYHAGQLAVWRRAIGKGSVAVYV